MKRISIFILIFFMIFNAFAGIDEGLVFHYKFDGDAKDETGNTNDGTVYGAQLTTDRLDRQKAAYLFDGEDDYIDFGDVDVDFTNTFSISSWIYMENTSTQTILCKHKGDSDQDGWHFKIHEGQLSFRWGDNSWQYENSINLISDKWYHVVFAYNDDTDQFAFYVNGEMVTSGIRDINVSENNYPLLAGKQYQGTLND